jgi:hypothetical protein
MLKDSNLNITKNIFDIKNSSELSDPYIRAEQIPKILSINSNQSNQLKCLSKSKSIIKTNNTLDETSNVNKRKQHEFFDDFPAKKLNSNENFINSLNKNTKIISSKEEIMILKINYEFKNF